MLPMEDFEGVINYCFKDKSLLKTALTHRSYLGLKFEDGSKNLHNERLEFLGDAVLEMVVTEFLYDNYNKPEGYLTALRSALVNYRTIGEVGFSLKLEKYLFMGKGQTTSCSGDMLSMVADAVEAVLGAIYLDGGFKPAKEFIKTFILIKLPDIIKSKVYRDSKTEFQELVQKKFKTTPRYKVIESSGKDHEKVFVCGVYIESKQIAVGRGRSKQLAETVAASEGLKIFLNNGQ